MKTSAHSILTSFLLLACLSANAQPLDLYDAVGLALERNYNVKMAGYAREIGENIAVPGQVGLLPSVYLDGSANYQLLNTDITFANPNQESIAADGATTINYSAGAYVGYTLFNGGRRLHSLSVLQSESEDSRLQEKLAMEATSLDVGFRFLEAVLAAERAALGEELVKLSLDRVQRAGDSYKFGTINRLSLLNAEVDLRNDSLLLNEALVEQARTMRNLNVAIGVPADTLLSINPSYDFAQESNPLNLDALLQSALDANTSYLRSRNALYTADEALKVTKSDFFPTLNAQAGYQYSFSDFEANFLNTSENVGWNAGLSLRFFLFDGGRVRRNVEIARLNTLIAASDESQARLELTAIVRNAYDQWVSALTLLGISERNAELAQLSYERSVEAQATGQITGLELRTAQVNLISARNEINTRKVRAKLAELSLLFEAGLILR